MRCTYVTVLVLYLHRLLGYCRFVDLRCGRCGRCGIVKIKTLVAVALKTFVLKLTEPAGGALRLNRTPLTYPRKAC